MGMTDADYMDRALFLAARGRGRTSPNPMVGAVVVSPDGVVVGQGFHERAGEAHAEVRALDMAGDRARGATLYCTLEPCAHVGRTGPCAQRIVDAGVQRVVAAIEDPNPLVRGQGFAHLREHGVAVAVGIGAAQSARLNQAFLTLMRERRPFVVLKAATSLDGCIAEAPRTRTLLTSAAANRHAQGLSRRSRCDWRRGRHGAGRRSAADGPWHLPERPLTRVIFDRHLRTPVMARPLRHTPPGLSSS